MRTKLFLGLASLAALSLGLVTDLARAQESQIDSRIVIEQPRNGETVGTVFTVSGTFNPECGMYNQVFIYNDQESRFYFVPVAAFERDNTFSYRVDTRNALNTPEFHEGNQTPQLPPNGSYTLSVSPRESNCTVDFQSNTWKVDRIVIRHDQTDLAPRGRVGQASTPPPAIRNQIAPTPSPTPTMTALGTAEPAIGADNKELPPWAWLLIGALGGAILLGLGEYSAHVYHKKHPRRR